MKKYQFQKQQRSPVPFRQEFEVMAAPTNAHITDIHKLKQLKSPFLPSRTVLKMVAPTAHKGATIQKTMSWALNETFHQYTKTMPIFKLAAAMIQPK